MEFLDLSKTFGTDSISYHDLAWLRVNLSDNFGLSDLTPDSLARFRAHLNDDRGFAQDYLVSKMGFDPFQSNQVF